MERLKDWIEFVNRSESELELDGRRSSAQRGRPFGSEDWVIKIANQLGIESTMNSRGRPNRNEKTPFSARYTIIDPWQRNAESTSI